MANIPLHFSARVFDGLLTNKTTVVYLELPDTTTLAQLAAAQGTWLSALDGLSTGAITEALVQVRPALPGGLKSATGSTWLASRNMIQGLFRFSAAGTTKEWSSNVPAIDPTVFVGKSINTGAGSVTTYTGLLAGTGAGPYVNPQNQFLQALTKALKGERTSRKQLN